MSEEDASEQAPARLPTVKLTKVRAGHWRQTKKGPVWVQPVWR